MSADSRSSKHYKSCRFEIKSTQPGSQIYAAIDRYLLAIIMFKQSSYQFEKCLQNVIAMHAGKGLYTSCGKTWQSIQHKFYHSKTSSRFPNFDASNAWEMGHNWQEGIFLGQELLLDFAAWLDLTLNADNTIMVYQLPLKFQNTFWFFKMCWWVYQGLMMPLNHQAGIQGTLKCLWSKK